jgi:hypothetical protein
MLKTDPQVKKSYRTCQDYGLDIDLLWWLLGKGRIIVAYGLNHSWLLGSQRRCPLRVFLDGPGWKLV